MQVAASGLENGRRSSRRSDAVSARDSQYVIRTLTLGNGHREWTVCTRWRHTHTHTHARTARIHEEGDREGGVTSTVSER